MYGRADGMPSFQLTVAVCARFADFLKYVSTLTSDQCRARCSSEPIHNMAFVAHEFSDQSLNDISDTRYMNLS
jgi:hypothetical protein